MLHHLLVIVLELGIGLVLPIPAFLLYRTDRYNRIFRIFMSFSVLLGGNFLLDSLNRLLLHMEYPVGSFFFRWADGLTNFAMVSLVYMGSVFPRRTHVPERGKTLFRFLGARFSPMLWALFWLSILLGFLNFTPLYFAGGHFNFLTGLYEANKGPIYFTDKIFVFVCLSWAMRLQYSFYASQSKDPRKEHSRYMIYAISFFAGGFSISLLLRHLSWYGNEAMALWGLSSFIFCIFIYNILSNMGVSYRAALLRNFLLLLVYLLFLSPFVFISYKLLKLTDKFPIWLIVVLSSLLFIGFQYLISGVSPLLSKWIFRQSKQESQAIHDYNSSIQRLDAKDRRSIPKKLLEFLSKHYEPSFVAIYFSQDETRLPQSLMSMRLRLDPVFAKKIDDLPSAPAVLPAGVLELLYNLMLREEWGGLLVDLLYKAERLGLKDLVRELVELSACGAEMILPLFLPEDLESYLREESFFSEKPPIGVLLCGQLKSGRSLTQKDLEMLRLLVTPTVLALKNSDLLQSTLTLKEKLEEENKKISKELAKDYRIKSDRLTEYIHSQTGPMPEILSRARRFAQGDSPILITGETGTGKSELARLIHKESGRKGEFVILNCSAIPSDLIENELFGHEKGAYTGAVEASRGLVERADNGSLFLDEIGELGISSQTKLLRLVQDGEYERLGSSQTQRSSARFLFASNRDLEAEIEAGRFRKDLYYRISTFEIHLPPLRNRTEDLPLLVDYLLNEAAESLGRPNPGIDESARELLYQYSYPGNIRELENLILRALVLSEGSLITSDHLPVLFRNKLDLDDKKNRLKRILEEREELEREMIIEALALKKGSQREAAKLLQISRGALQYKIKQYGLN